MIRDDEGRVIEFFFKAGLTLFVGDEMFSAMTGLSWSDRRFCVRAGPAPQCDLVA